MFRTFIYLDEERMYTYLRQIDGEYTINLTESTTKKSKGAQIGISTINVNATTEVEEKKRIAKDSSNDYDRFEEKLKTLEGEEYFDFVLHSGYDLSTVPPMSIIRICGVFEVPEEFDIYTIAPRFMDIIKGQIKTNNENEKEIIESFLKDASADIPILMDVEDIKVSGKLTSNNLREEYSELEEYNEQEVYMLCKVIRKIDKQEVEIFNPLKDFIHVPRAGRRHMNSSEENNLDSITIDGPVLKVEIIAIYK